MNRIDFTQKNESLTKNYFKKLLLELIGDRAIGLGIVVEKEPGVYEPTGEEFPKDLVDFLIFYKLLIILCKLIIAKYDEGKILDGLKKIQVKKDDI